MGGRSRIFTGVPPHAAGQVIGLMGGTFNPPHAGHRRISRIALRRLRLDQLWWMVTPGNPLKDITALPPLQQRLSAAADMAAHPRIAVSGAEAVLRTRYTADLVSILAERAHGVRFLWIMGSDNLAQFHHWEDWRRIAALVPIAVIGRPGFLATALSGRTATALFPYRLDETDARLLAKTPPPAWVFLNGPRISLSSTALRNGINPS